MLRNGASASCIIVVIETEVSDCLSNLQTLFNVEMAGRLVKQVPEINGEFSLHDGQFI